MVETTIKQQNHLLQQLCLGAHLLGHYLQAPPAVTLRNAQENPVSFSAKLECRESDIDQRYFFVVCATNNSCRAHTIGWLVNVHVTSVSMAGADSQTDDSNISMNRAVPLAHLAQGQSQDISIEMSRLHVIDSLPVRLTVCAVLQFPSTGFVASVDRRFDDGLPDWSEAPLVIPVLEQTFDVVHVLRPIRNPRHLPESSPSACSTSFEQIVKTMAQERTRCLAFTKESPRPTAAAQQKAPAISEHLSCCLSISHNTVKTLLGKSFKRGLS